MCGRFAIDDETNELLEQIAAQHGYAAIGDWRKPWPANYNVAPTQQVPVVRSLRGVVEIAAVRWGMVPSSSPTFGGGKPVINARIETVDTNGLFKRAFLGSRCIVPARGYYEWQVREDGKQPYFIHEPGQPLALAGVVGAWRDRSKDEEDPEAWRLSMSIITLDAHAIPGEVHDRMPAFLTPDTYDDWLGDHLGAAELTDLLKHSSDAVANELEFYEVSRSVNKVQKSKGIPNDGIELIAPLREGMNTRED